MDGLDCSAEEFNTSILDQHTLISSNAYPHKKTLFLRYAMSIHFHPWNRLQICLGLGGSTPSAQFPGQAAVGDTDHTTLTKFRHAVIVDSIFPTVKPASKATFFRDSILLRWFTRSCPAKRGRSSPLRRILQDSNLLAALPSSPTGCSEHSQGSQAIKDWCWLRGTCEKPWALSRFGHGGVDMSRLPCWKSIYHRIYIFFGGKDGQGIHD